MDKQQLRNKIRNCLAEQQHQINLRKSAIQQRNNRSTKFYQSGRWKHLRDSIMNSFPICYNCNKHGIITPATELHHAIPFLSGDNEQQQWQLFLDQTNLVPLCNYCHKKIHELMRHEHHIIDIRDTMNVLPQKINENELKNNINK